MQTETGRIIALLVIAGWIPILALGKATAMVIHAFRGDYVELDFDEEEEGDDSDNGGTESCS